MKNLSTPKPRFVSPLGLQAGPKESGDSSSTRYNLIFFALLIPVFIIYAFDFPYRDLYNSDAYLLQIFEVIAALATVGLYLSCKVNRFNVFVAHWAFILVFFAMAPAMQQAMDAVPAQAVVLQAGPYAYQAAIMVVVWSLCMLALQTRYQADRLSHVETSFVPRLNVYRCLALSCLSTGALVAVTGFSGLISRAESMSQVTHEDSPVMIPIMTTGRAIPLVCAIMLIRRWKDLTSSHRAAAVFIAFLAVVSNVPTGVPRYWIGAIGIGIVALLIKKYVRTSLWLTVALISSLALAMPFLNSFRSFTSLDDVNRTNIKVGSVSSTMVSDDFDAYAMLTNSAWYMDTHQPTMGWNLFGNLLFFVPKSLWEDKPGSTNWLIIKDSTLGRMNDNLSQPLPAEFLINFGYAGIPLGALAFYWLATFLDRKYRRPDRRVAVQAITVFYPFALGFTIFLMRGGFIAAFAYSCGFYMACFFAIAFCQDRTPILEAKASS